MRRVSYGNCEDSQPPLLLLSQKSSTLNTMFSSPIPTPAYCGYLVNKDFLAAVNHHSSNYKGEKNKREDSINIEEMSMGAARWTPTPEQLYALEEIYQSGTRTPSAALIQQIAARLRRFGKIEGKNVFYWFQNHKARERQKRRRQQLHNSSSPNEHLQIKGQSLGLRTCFEVGQAKNWLTPSDCSTISEESVVSSLATAEVAKGEMDDKIRFEDRGLKLELSIGTGEQKIMEFSHISHAVDQRAQNHKKIWMPPYRDMTKTDQERKYQTLELFPNWTSDHDDRYQMTDGPKFDDHSEIGTAIPSSKFTKTHFFEFLPLKYE